MRGSLSFEAVYKQFLKGPLWFSKIQWRPRRSVPPRFFRRFKSYPSLSRCKSPAIGVARLYFYVIIKAYTYTVAAVIRGVNKKYYHKQGSAKCTYITYFLHTYYNIVAIGLRRLSSKSVYDNIIMIVVLCNTKYEWEAHTHRVRADFCTIHSQYQSF